MARDFGRFVECDACREKPGHPVLCNSCVINRDVIDRQAEWIETLEKQVDKMHGHRRILEKQVQDLRSGECRFNCRTGRAMWIFGFAYAIKASGLQTDRTAANEAYDHWREITDG